MFSNVEWSWWQWKLESLCPTTQGWHYTCTLFANIVEYLVCTKHPLEKLSATILDETTKENILQKKHWDHMYPWISKDSFLYATNAWLFLQAGKQTRTSSNYMLPPWEVIFHQGYSWPLGWPFLSIDGLVNFQQSVGQDLTLLFPQLLSPRSTATSTKAGNFPSPESHIPKTVSAWGTQISQTSTVTMVSIAL